MPSQELVVGGWKEEQGRFKSLVVGVYGDEGLTYVGRVETGFSGKAVIDLMKRLRPLERGDKPFDTGQPSSLKGVRWTEPAVVISVDIAEWTPAGRVRQSSFKGVREDKDPREVRAEH